MKAHPKLRRLLIPSADHGLFIRACVCLALIDVALKLLGFQRVLQWAGPHGDSPRRSPSGAEVRQACRYARMLDRASRYHLVRARCLHRSLALHHWLCQRGLQSELRIGVRKENGMFSAHAWVELGGYVVYDTPAAVARFIPLSEPAAVTALQSLRRASERHAHPFDIPLNRGSNGNNDR